MNNLILFEISKYVCAPTGIKNIDDARNSKDSIERDRAFAKDLLAKRINHRPSIVELETRNIMKREELSFEHIHEILNGIDFKKNKPGKIAPSIAGRVSKLNFALKKKILVQKLGLNEIEQFLNRK
ncbi:hypothetical protein PAEPH01_0344 [Pancytospora epiphaga]|nr:hypothetical protein PAEPH01_0344 [Pancytospora epiphaga]